MKFKKGAMLRFCSFMSRTCHPALDAGSQKNIGKFPYKPYIKFGILRCGAMFGLDARIALVIFGALSVISGAALYGAIQNAKATSLLAEMNEVGKAWESFYLDTSSELSHVDLDKSGDGYHLLVSKELVEKPSGVIGWKGPYLPYEVAGTYYLDYPSYGYIRMAVFRSDITWDDWRVGKCVTGVPCSLWVYMSGFKSNAIAKAIDEKVDGGDGIINGNFRWYCYTSGGDFSCDYYLKYAPYKNIHDS